MTFSSGNFYEGEWKDNKHHGKGKMTYINGNIGVYEGSWKEHKLHGRGWDIYCNILTVEQIQLVGY